MSKIFNGTKDKELEFTASQMLDSERRKREPDSSMTFVKITLSVLGNSAGKKKTAGETALGSTGGSYQALYGSDYCVADVTIPIEWNFGKTHMNEIMSNIAETQKHLSENLTEIQGELTPDQEKVLRDSAMRSQAIREAKDEIKNRADEDFDQNTFNKANSSVRASVVSDMSLNGGIECTAAVPINSEEAKSARDRGWKTAKEDRNILTTRSKEKGLKSVYLMDAERVSKAQDYIYELGEKIQKMVNEDLASGWSNEISLNILKKVNALVVGTSSGKIKLVPDYTPDELSTIAGFKKLIIDAYDSMMRSFDE